MLRQGVGRTNGHLHAEVGEVEPGQPAVQHASRVEHLAVAQQVNRIDVYKEAAAASKTPVPKDVMRASKLIDGVVWDGRDPKKYADGFKVHA